MKYYVGSQNSSSLRLLGRKAMSSRRFTRIATALTVLVISLGFVNTAVSQAPQQYEVVRVQAKDTLWDIALRYSSPEQDVRMLIYEIKRVNNLPDSFITPGEDLRIPVASTAF